MTYLQKETVVLDLLYEQYCTRVSDWGRIIHLLINPALELSENFANITAVTQYSDQARR